MKRVKKILSYIIMFLIGYILGELKLYRIALDINSGFKRLDIVEKIGFASSVITVILFILFIVSKVIIIHMMKETIYEEAEVLYSDKNESLKIIEEYDLGDNHSEKVYIFI